MRSMSLVFGVLLAAMPAFSGETATRPSATGQEALAGDVPASGNKSPRKPEDDSGQTEPKESQKETPGITADLRKRLEHLSHLRISGYVQPQFLHSQSSADKLGGNQNQFSVRRGRIKFTYQMLPTSRMILQPDITSSGVTLKDGYVELVEPWTTWKHTLTAGQFNWPFGFEIMYSSSLREMPERPRVVRTLFPGERDRGVMLSGRGAGQRFRYQLAVVNGSGTTQSADPNKRKDVVARATWAFGALDAGASIYRGSDLVATSYAVEGAEFDKERQGIDVQWTTPLRGLKLRGEYISGKQAPASGSDRTRSHDVDGWYVYAIRNFGKRHQLVARVDQYDPDTTMEGNAIRTVGGSYIVQWDKNSKVMLAYERPKHQVGDTRDDVFTLRYQFSF